MSRRIRLRVEGREMVVVQSDVKGSPGDNAGHSSYCVGRKDVHLDLGAFRRMCGLVTGSPDSVLEMFGGSGWHSAAIQEIIRPSKHESWDFDDDCVASMRASLPDLKVRCLDSYAGIEAVARSRRRFDWVHADFNQFTWMKHLRDKAYDGVLDAIFTVAKNRVTITDSAIFGLVRFKRNLEGYQKVLGFRPLDSWEDYFRAVGAEYRNRWGFGITQVIHWSGMASMYLLERDSEAITFPILKHTEHARIEQLD